MRLLGDGVQTLEDQCIIVAKISVLHLSRKLQWTPLLLLLAQEGFPLLGQALFLQLCQFFVEFIVVFEDLR